MALDGVCDVMPVMRRSASGHTSGTEVSSTYMKSGVRSVVVMVFLNDQVARFLDGPRSIFGRSQL